jgi:hypothetical protein
MTPQEINTAARQRYNAVGDTFWSDDEVYALIYQASLELALEGFLIEQVFSSTTTASQQEYSYPTNAVAIKRITYNGLRLSRIDFRQDDLLTTFNQATTSTGTPQYYVDYNQTIYLRPIPDAAQTLKVWAYVEPQEVTSSSTLEIPSEWHMSIVNFILREMSAKNKNYEGANFYGGLWERDKKRAIEFGQRKKRGDSFAVVTDVDLQPETIIGTI